MQSGIEDTANHFKFSVEETQKYLKEACAMIYEHRMHTPSPSLDDKIATGWNGNKCISDVYIIVVMTDFMMHISATSNDCDLFTGLMISGFARAGIAVKNKKYVEAATEAATFVEKYLFNKKKRVLLRCCYRSKQDDSIVQRLLSYQYPYQYHNVRSMMMMIYRSVPILGFHEDYAFFVKGLLDLYEATFNPHWVEFAEELQNIQDKLFWDPDDGGYFAMAEESPILTRTKDCMFGCSSNFSSIIKCQD